MLGGCSCQVQGRFLYLNGSSFAFRTAIDLAGMEAVRDLDARSSDITRLRKKMVFFLSLVMKEVITPRFLARWEVMSPTTTTTTTKSTANLSNLGKKLGWTLIRKKVENRKWANCIFLTFKFSDFYPITLKRLN